MRDKRNHKLRSTIAIVSVVAWLDTSKRTFLAIVPALGTLHIIQLSHKILLYALYIILYAVTALENFYNFKKYSFQRNMLR